jgi:Flp pilus assembly protein TadG
MLKNSWRFWRKAICPLNFEVGQRGSELTEFALVAILLFTFLFGIIDFGRALYTYHFVSEAAREATRFAIVRGSSCNPRLNACPASAADVQNYVRNSITPSGINPPSVSVTTTWPGSAPGAALACNQSNGKSNNPGCEVQVQVTYPYKFMFPLLPTGTLTMTSTSEMIISQ